MGGGVQHVLDGAELFLVGEEKENRPPSAHLQPQPSSAVASSEFPYGVVPTQSSVNLQADHHLSSTLASVACNASTPESIAGPEVAELVPNTCNTESETNDESSYGRNLAAVTKDSQSLDLLHRNRDIASTLGVLKHYFERGDIASDVRRTKLEAEAAGCLSLLIQKIQSQNDLLHGLIHTIREKRKKIRSYKPGDGLDQVGGVSRMDVAIPEMTTLLLVGPSGAGKSTLINNLIRVLNNSTSGFDRAQAYEEKGNGSLFLQEYSVYTAANHFSVFDSRGFSENHIIEDLGAVRKWMTDGICHGEAVCRPSDNASTKDALEGRSRQRHDQFTSKREVNFVIFVVNALSVHNWKESRDMRAIGNLAALYKNPFLTFKDDRPVVVMTHGDKLSPENRILSRILIGKVFGVSPLDQVFDVSCCTERSVNPGNVDPVSDLTLLNMLDFALARADRNLPYKKSAALRFAKARTMAYQAFMDHWNDVEYDLKVALLAIIFLLVCFAMLLAVRHITIHKPNPWRSLRCIALKKSLGWLKKASRRC